MKFHLHTPYFKLGPYRVQFTAAHINGPYWTGEPSGLNNPARWLPEFYKYAQEFCGFVTVSRGVIVGLLSLAVDICDTRIRA